MDTLTLIDQKEQLRKKAEELITNAEKEIRKLNDGEATELNHLKKEIASIDSQIKGIEEENKRNTNHKSIKRLWKNFHCLKLSMM